MFELQGRTLLVRKIIDYQVQLFRKRFRYIGNMYDATTLQSPSTGLSHGTVPLGTEHLHEPEHFCLGQIVSIPYFFHEHSRLDIPRDPTLMSKTGLQLVSILRLYRWTSSLSTATMRTRKKAQSVKTQRQMMTTKNRKRQMNLMMTR